MLIISRHVMGAKLRTAAAVGGVAAASVVAMAAAGAVFLALHQIAPRVEAVFPENRLVARPAPVNVMMLDVGPGRIPEAMAGEIARWPGVQSVARQVAITFPLSAQATIVGNELNTDAIVNGVDGRLVEGEVAPGQVFAFNEGASGPVPVMASRYFLDMYNLGYAESQGLPRVNDAAVIGRHFRLALGESISSGPRPVKKVVNCQIVGLTRNVNLIGLIVPIEYSIQWNAWYKEATASQGGGLLANLLGALNKPNPTSPSRPSRPPSPLTPSDGYTALHISAASAQAYANIERRLTEKGLRVESHRDLLGRARLLLAAVTGGSMAFALAVLVLAGFNVWNTFTLILMQQREQIGILKAVGAAPRHVLILFGAEALLLAVAGAAVGAAITAAAAIALRYTIVGFAASFEFLGPMSFRPAVVVAAAALPVVVLVVCLFALPQIARAARRPVRELL